MSAPPDPERFRPSKAVLVIDWMMTHIIKVGGVGIIIAVLGILVFIGVQVIPLFAGAKVEHIEEREGGADEWLALGLDEWGELPFLFGRDGTLLFLPADGAPPIQESIFGDGPAKPISAIAHKPTVERFVVALADGGILPVHVTVERRSEDGDAEGKLVPVVEAENAIDLDVGDGASIERLSFADSDDTRMLAAIIDGSGGRTVKAIRYKRKVSLLGTGKWELDDQFSLTEFIDGSPEKILVNSAGDAVIIANESGVVQYLFLRDDGAFEKRQTFRPFPDGDLASMQFLLGDVSLVTTSEEGKQKLFSLYRADDESPRKFGETRSFADVDGAPNAYATSLRNKSFAVATDAEASIHHGTTADVRWREDLDFKPVHAALNRKHTRLAILDAGGKVHLYSLEDPHPEAGWRMFFGKVWYEGASRPEYTWQSTGGTDENEPKLSLMPLIHGTLKGTLYAMIFALPIALLAAVYTSQFLHPNIKAVVKPTMEIMASLPSVVLGFLGALWLAPRIENHTVALILIVLFIPIGSWVLGWLWSRLPMSKRKVIRPGYEFLVFAPILIFGVWLCWQLGSPVEGVLFGGSFRDWWTQTTGLSFQARNCVIIGIMMGFAVIPIVFTITEDALSSVPDGLRSASLACGASRWQTAWRVVLPTASAGIFSAVMIGIGRAVGETMIVVMATGNTPIMEWNIFSGMRTLSANIAVELPEAPEHGTLYRTLFLGGFVLFIMTFILNTLAELLRQHLREKYKTV